MNADDTPTPANTESRTPPPSEPYAERSFLSDATGVLIGLGVKDAYGWAKEQAKEHLARPEPEPSQIVLPPGVNDPADE